MNAGRRKGRLSRRCGLIFTCTTSSIDRHIAVGSNTPAAMSSLFATLVRALSGSNMRAKRACFRAHCKIVLVSLGSR